MKKFIIHSLFILALATPFISKADEFFAKDDAIEKISSNVLQHFGYTFYRAQNVTWSINKDYQKATFILNSKVTYAIYDLNNNFLVATQVASVDELPEKSKLSLEQNYADYKTVHVLKIVSRPLNYELEDDTDAFWVELQKGQENLVAVAFPNSDLNVVKKEKR